MTILEIISVIIIKCFSIETPKIINFPSVPNEKLMFLGVIFKLILIKAFNEIVVVAPQ